MDAPGERSALRPHQLPGLPLEQVIDPADLLGPATGFGSVEVSGISSDSRLVRPGDLYLALSGEHTHGARFLPQAVSAGAVAVLTDLAGRDVIDQQQTEQQQAEQQQAEQQQAEQQKTEDELPVLVVREPRALMARLSADIYRRPAEAMIMLGVTGTNGKTTTSYLLQAGLRAAGRRTGLIGTLGYLIDDEILPGARTTVTTPEAPEVQGLLAAMRERAADAVAMEVSSHALALGRADAIVFDAVGFTNFGRDHLDFHGTEQAYFEAKASLFTAARARHAVINIDDPRGHELVRRARAEGVPVSTTSLAAAREPAPGSTEGGVDSVDSADPADFAVQELEVGADRTTVVLRTPRGPLHFALGLPGVYNVHNAVTALAMLDAAGIDPVAASAGFAELSVPGRMQAVDLGPQAPNVYVDFAHTPQAITSVLSALVDRARPATGEPGRLICVIGCGGDRDPVKRRPMGAAAARGADVVIITDDNPRSEDPAAIRAEALAGAQQAMAEDNLPIDLQDGGNRRDALRTALQLAGPHDVIAVLGKGHETGQEIDGRVWPFDDVDVVEALWHELGADSVGAGGAR